MDSRLIIWAALLVAMSSCSIFESDDSEINKSNLEFGGDLSLTKKIEDEGGLYKLNGVVKEGFEIFAENNYTWVRLRLFHTPDMDGVLCNDLSYTISSAQKARNNGMKILLNIHFSDKNADTGHQLPPSSWQGLSYDGLRTEVYEYTRDVINEMYNAGVVPHMVQIGNQINNGFLWPHGKLWNHPGPARWKEMGGLINSAIEGIKAASGGPSIKIMIHGANTGDVNSCYKFYKNLIDQKVEFDVIGLSYYPWWHGDFREFEHNILYLSGKFAQDISIVETSYYANNWYPSNPVWVSSSQPYPANERGQYFYMLELASIAKRLNKVTSIFYCRPDEMSLPKSDIDFLGRGLFDSNGDALDGISAWKDL